jgi:hypothetical protein
LHRPHFWTKYPEEFRIFFLDEKTNFLQSENISDLKPNRTNHRLRNFKPPVALFSPGRIDNKKWPTPLH